MKKAALLALVLAGCAAVPPAVSPPTQEPPSAPVAPSWDASLDGKWELATFNCGEGQRRRRRKKQPKQYKKSVQPATWEHVIEINHGLVLSTQVFQMEPGICTIVQKQTWDASDGKYLVKKIEIVSVSPECKTKPDDRLSGVSHKYVVKGDELELYLTYQVPSEPDLQGRARNYCGVHSPIMNFKRRKESPVPVPVPDTPATPAPAPDKAPPPDAPTPDGDSDPDTT